MTLKLSRILFLFCLVVAIGCQDQRKLSLAELNAYILNKDNGLVQTVSKGDVVVEMIYRPLDLIIYQQLDSISAKAWDSTYSKFEGLHYFVMRISKDGREIEGFFAADPTRYSQVVSYLAGDLSDAISLRTESKTIPLESSVYAPTFGSSNASSILLTFRIALDQQTEDVSVIFSDTRLGIGRIEFKFDYDDIKQIPRLMI